MAFADMEDCMDNPQAEEENVKRKKHVIPDYVNVTKILLLFHQKNKIYFST